MCTRVAARQRLVLFRARSETSSKMHTSLSAQAGSAARMACIGRDRETCSRTAEPINHIWRSKVRHRTRFHAAEAPGALAALITVSRSRLEPREFVLSSACCRSLWPERFQQLGSGEYSEHNDG